MPMKHPFTAIQYTTSSSSKKNQRLLQLHLSSSTQSNSSSSSSNNKNTFAERKSSSSKNNSDANSTDTKSAPAPAPAPQLNNNNPKRKLTLIEKANQDYKQKRLRDRLERQWRMIQAKLDDGSESISQRLYDETLGICAAANEWDMFNDIIQLMKEKNNKQDNNNSDSLTFIDVQSSTYRACLKECFNVGNSQSALRIFHEMKFKHFEWEGSDFDHVIGAICKDNQYDDNEHGDGYDTTTPRSQKLFDITDIASEYYKTVNKDCNIKVESYNSIITTMENDRKWHEALQLLSRMEDTLPPSSKASDDKSSTVQQPQLHPKPNLATYHAVLNVLISNNQFDRAVELLLSLSSLSSSTSTTNKQTNPKPKPSTYTFEIVLSALTKNDYRGAKYKQAIQLIQSMTSLHIAVPTEMYNRAISSCAKAKNPSEAMSLFTKMKERKVEPDTVTYNALISACANGGLVKDALRLFEECKNSDHGARPDVITYTSTIKACGKSRMSKRALKLLADAKKESIPLDVFLYTAVIDVCAKDKEWRKALELLKDMKRNNIIANQHTYSAVINALGNSGQWERALDILDQMKEKDMRVNTVAYNSAISALAKAARGGSNTNNDHNINLWEKSLDILNQMKRERVWPDNYSYSSAISCCASYARYQEALDLIQVMKNGPAKIRPNRISYTGAITACARAGEWAHALQLFKDMKTDRIEYDVFAYNALVSSFQNAGKPSMAYDVWNEMCGRSESNITGMSKQEIKIKPDIITLTSVIACLERAEGVDNLDKMDLVFEDAVERQIILNDDSMDTMWEIDLSGFSLAVARAACRYILNNRLLLHTEDQQYEDLMLITGVGKYQQNEVSVDDGTKQSRTALREYVRQVLREDFDPPLYSIIPSYAKGTIQVNKDVIKQWIQNQKR